jgi:hypothetical protein
MWILPKQLHTLASVQATEALSLDLNESSQLCAQSLFVRSKPSPLRTWLQKWKRDSWTQHLFGRILKPSLGKAFETEWTSLLGVIPASHSVQQESEPAKTIPDICGLGLQMELLPCDPESAFSRTSRDTSRWDSPASSAIWKKWVTKCRGEYSARLSAVRLTNANECLSWPTTAARDYKGTSLGYLFRSDGKSRVDQLPVAVDQAEKGVWPTPTTAEAGKIGNQANHGQLASSNHPALRGEVTREKFEKGKHGPAAPVNPSTHGSRPESWLTPRANEPTGDSNFVTRNADRGEHCHGSLTQQMKSWATPCSRDHHPNGQAAGSKTDLANQAAAWATPTARDHKSDRGNEEREYSELTPMVERTQSGKLNPRWVETLMGLPVGWTMPSCASPVTIVPTSCDC